MTKTLNRTYWIKSRFSKTSSLEEILTVRSKYWASFCCLKHIQFSKFIKIIWHKYNLIISSIVSGHPDQYLYEIPHEYLSGREKPSEKIISAELKRYFPYCICSNVFKDSFIFGETTSSQFFRVTTSTQQLLFRSSYFVRTATFFWGAPFPEQSHFCCSYFFHNSYFFRAKLLPSSLFLWTVGSLGQLPCLNSYFFDGRTCSE